MIRKDNESFKIYQRVFDERTLRFLAQMAGRGYFDSLDYPISTGKEADVFRATTKNGNYRAIKIYRIETSNFRKMAQYLEADQRFHVKKNLRTVVETWCQKEFRNLRDAHDAGVCVPKPYKFMKNILVMDFIGEKGVPAPLLKNVRPENPKKILSEIYSNIRKLWKAGLVHGDLNEYNILLKGGRIFFIDMSQAVPVTSRIAPELIERDLLNLEKLAKKYGVKFNFSKLFARKPS